MTESLSDELLNLNRELLESIRAGDWEKYAELCDPTLTCFEPETLGQLVEGMEFHRFYFDLGGHMGGHQSTIAAPHVRLLGDDAAVVCYVRLVQAEVDGKTTTKRFEETRVWQKQDGKWKHVPLSPRGW